MLHRRGGILPSLARAGSPPSKLAFEFQVRLLLVELPAYHSNESLGTSMPEGHSSASVFGIGVVNVPSVQ